MSAKKIQTQNAETPTPAKMLPAVNIVQLDEAKDLAQTIANGTAQEIIQHIASNPDTTASNISKALKLPASTVHYNLKALVNNNIVDDSNFHYSEKGKTVSHYKLADKVIIIVPKKNKTQLLTQLSAFIPGLIAIGALCVGFAVTLFSKTGASVGTNIDMAFKDAAPRAVYAVEEAAIATTADAIAPAAGEVALQATTNASTSVISTILSNEFVLGVVASALVLVGGAVLYIFAKKKKQKKNSK